MAANLPLPKQIVAHAHWTMNKQKMSKSRGNVVEPLAAMERFGVDTMRYYLLRDGGLADDGGMYNISRGMNEKIIYSPCR
jgi:methionyl-tRNA synthetase